MNGFFTFYLEAFSYLNDNSCDEKYLIESARNGEILSGEKESVSHQQRPYVPLPWANQPDGRNHFEELMQELFDEMDKKQQLKFQEQTNGQ